MAPTRTSTTSASMRRIAAPQDMDRRTLFRGAGAAGILAVTGALAGPLRASAAGTSPATSTTTLQAPNSEISREDVIERAMFWVENPRPNSIDGSSPGIDGMAWRMDCSGFVSMAWNLRRSDGDTGTGTGQLPEVLEPIEEGDLRPGDALLLTPGDNGQSGHVVLFDGWNNDLHTEYRGLEQVRGSIGETTRRTIAYPYDSENAKRYTPYRYPQITG